MPGLQPVAINRLQDRHEQSLDLHGERLQFLVERSLPEVVVDVADEVDEALLLPARHRVVAGVEIADQHALVSGQHLADDVGLPRLGHAEDDVLAVGEHPDVVVHALDVDLGLIDVDEVALQDRLEDGRLGRGIVAGEVRRGS